MIDLNVNKFDYQRKSKVINGYIKPLNLYSGNKIEYSYSKPLPHLSRLIHEILGREVVIFLWGQFLLHNVDESEMIIFSDICQILNDFREHFDYSIPLNSLGFSGVESDDYIGFVDLCEKITKVIYNLRPSKPKAELKSHRIICCNGDACKHYTGFNLTQSNNCVDVKTTESYTAKFKHYNHRLFVAYRKWTADHNNVIRNKHIIIVMRESEIPLDKNRMPPSFWSLRGDFLVESYEVLENIAEIIRTDFDTLREDQAKEKPFYLPLWLKSEFNPSDLTMFRHYYSKSKHQQNTETVVKKSNDFIALSPMIKLGTTKKNIRLDLEECVMRFLFIIENIGASISITKVRGRICLLYILYVFETIYITQYLYCDVIIFSLSFLNL